MSTASAPAVPALSERVLWAGALLVFGLGDLLTTAVGLQLGAVELSPVGSDVLHTLGWPGLVAIKLSLLAALWLAVRFLSSLVRWAVALALVVLGVLLVGWNSLVIWTLV